MNASPPNRSNDDAWADDSPADESRGEDSNADGSRTDQPPPQTLEFVWRTFGDQLRRRARTRLRQYGLSGQTESMDICNDVMADLARRGPATTSPDEVLRYVLRAIDNQVLDTFRTLARQCRDFRRHETTRDSMGIDRVQADPDASTPSQIAVRREVIEAIKSNMSEDEIRAIDMMLENRDWSEIGLELGVPPDTARMRVQRAIKKVRQRMDPPAGESPL